MSEKLVDDRALPRYVLPPLMQRVAELEAALQQAQATILHMQALVEQRGEDLQWLIEQVEPTLLAQHRHKGDPYETCEARACTRVREIKARLAALLSSKGVKE